MPQAKLALIINKRRMGYFADYSKSHRSSNLTIRKKDKVSSPSEKGKRIGDKILVEIKQDRRDVSRSRSKTKAKHTRIEKLED